MMQSFRAMILAAGLGTRLRPLTLNRPKVLVPVQNRPLLHWLVEYLRTAGAEAIVVNAYHLGRMLKDHVERRDFGIPVEVRVEDGLMGTGGGIRNVVDFWDERPLVVINGDILSAIDLQELLREHIGSGADATLVLTDEPRFNEVQVAEDGRILSFGGEAGSSLAFTGIQVIIPQVLDGIPADTPSSIIDCYRRLMASGRKVTAHVVKEQFWRELGSLDAYLQVHKELVHMEKEPVPGLQVGGKPMVHGSARLGARVRLSGMVCVGEGCRLGDGVMVQDSVLWDQVRVKDGCSVRDSIIGDDVVVGASVKDAVLGV
ncbi:MAG: NDP-sugar synthase [Deltaproteobacteria bacterium]|nr:MAG: NDP-sugar synthase [Deltaproteobacteria bacterium]